MFSNKPIFAPIVHLPRKRTRKSKPRPRKQVSSYLLTRSKNTAERQKMTRAERMRSRSADDELFSESAWMCCVCSVRSTPSPNKDPEKRPREKHQPARSSGPRGRLRRGDPITHPRSSPEAGVVQPSLSFHFNGDCFRFFLFLSVQQSSSWFFVKLPFGFHKCPFNNLLPTFLIKVFWVLFLQFPYVSCACLCSFLSVESPGWTRSIHPECFVVRECLPNAEGVDRKAEEGKKYVGVWSRARDADKSQKRSDPGDPNPPAPPSKSRSFRNTKRCFLRRGKIHHVRPFFRHSQIVVNCFWNVSISALWKRPKDTFFEKGAH